MGATVSVAANIAHSYIAPEDAPRGWQPERGQVIGAAIWPLALAISSEVLARTTWGRRGRLIGSAGVALVAAVAAVVSYIHLSGLLAHWGEATITVIIGPLAVDGLMVVSTAALLASSPEAASSASKATGAASATEAAAASPQSAVPAVPSDVPNPPPARPKSHTPRKPRRRAVDVDDVLLPAAKDAVKRLHERGERINRDSLVAELREANHTCSNQRGSDLLAALRREGAVPKARKGVA